MLRGFTKNINPYEYKILRVYDNYEVEVRRF